jgi:hypothetical protein
VLLHLSGAKGYPPNDRCWRPFRESLPLPNCFSGACAVRIFAPSFVDAFAQLLRVRFLLSWK